MYRVLLVDDEYMITEGLKVLIPFEKWNMQVVSTANDAETALAYIKDNPVDLVITDVNMPGMNGLQMIEQMKNSLPNAAFIILSGYQEFEYVKTALNLQVADYLVKPVDKVELAAILEKLEREFDRSSNNQLELIFKEETSEDEIATYLKSFDSVWLGAAAQEKGLVSLPYSILGQTGYLFLSSQKEEALYLEEFTAPYKQVLQAFKLNLEKSLFYGTVSLQETNPLFSYYEPIYRVIIQGNIGQILDELDLLKDVVLQNTPEVSITKQLFIQFIMDVYHLFQHLKSDDMTTIIKKIESTNTFADLLAYMKDQLSDLFAQYRMNENVANVLEVIGRDYQKDLSLKDISKELYINPVYLGQLIKRETNSTFAELLNKQRIKAAQQLLLAKNDSIEDVCYAVGYSNVGYFYKVFRKLCGKSPKAYRKQVE
ncbi:response regulator [Streptococcus cristatus]|uniref:DNA-binding response regulator n=2 Tax=Streptococcus cristatus TaxID=45634 RepID=A0A512AD77_STRCR|nr:response regulator transcription factor [Streptococcus cristatus]AGK71942.1 response regulator [Streptococcus cristatus AS 1.3089]GEN97657.1 DNA-binding response regulator [Streptococcus cristatus]SQI49401.1 response regulator [Streptococcus cristatus]